MTTPDWSISAASDRAKVAERVSQALSDAAHCRCRDGAALEQAIARDLAPDDTPGLRADTKLRLATVLTRRVLDELSREKDRGMTATDIVGDEELEIEAVLNGQTLKAARQGTPASGRLPAP